jgi:hypothetical protein
MPQNGSAYGPKRAATYDGENPCAPLVRASVSAVMLATWWSP